MYLLVLLKSWLGDSEESVTGGASTTATYTFGDLDIDSGVSEMLEVTFEIEDNVALNGDSLEFTITIVEVEDENEDETYVSGGTPDLDDILSSNSFATKTIDVESASYELVQTTITNRTVVVGNGVEVVLYKGKLSVGDASAVTFSDIDFSTAATGAVFTGVGYDLEDILQSATINIGGVTEDADVEATGLEFNGLNIEVAAGADNVDVLVTGVLEDNDSVTTGEQFSVATSDLLIEAEDEDNEDVEGASETVTNTAAATLITLNEEGTFRAEIVTNGDFEDEIEDVVLAGSNAVILAEVELEAEDEDMDVDEMVFKVLGQDASTTLQEVRLMVGATTLDTAVVTYDSTDTLITFEDFMVEDTGSDVVATLEADIEIITDEGGEATATAGDIVVTLDGTTIKVDGDSSNNDIDVSGLSTTSSLAVNVTPVLVTAAIVDTLGDNDEFATVEFSVDFGNNDLDNDDLFLNVVTFEALDVASVAQIRNDDGTLISATAANPTLTVDTPLDPLAKVNDGDQFEFDANGTDEEEFRVIANGFQFVLNLNGDAVADANELFNSQNDNTLNFGQYNDVN